MNLKILSIFKSVSEKILIAVDPNPRTRVDFFAGSGGLPLTKILINKNFWQMDPKQIFKEMALHKYGVLCGAAAWLLMKVYEEQGYSSWTYSCGSPPESYITHAVTIVKNKKKYFLLDPTTGLFICLGTINQNWQLAIYKKSKILKNKKQLLLPVNFLEEISELAFLMPPLENRKKSYFNNLRAGVSLYKNAYCRPDVFNRHPWWTETSLFLSSKKMKPVPNSLFFLPMAVYSSQDGYITNPNIKNKSSELLKKFYCK